MLRNTSLKKGGSQVKFGNDVPKSPHLSQDEERYAKLKEGKKTVTKDAAAEYFRLELSPFFQAKLFEVLKIDGDVDFGAFQKLARLLEAQSVAERQKVVFTMFEPNAQGRIMKHEFKKTCVELLSGSTKQFPVSAIGSGPASALKPIVQGISDAVFSAYCSDENKGMDLREWINYASEDVEVCRLVGALDKRVIWPETTLRRRFLA